MTEQLPGFPLRPATDAEETAVENETPPAGEQSLPAYAAAAPPPPPQSSPAANLPGFAPLPPAVGAATAPPGTGSGATPEATSPAPQPPNAVKPKAQSQGGLGALIVVLICVVLIGIAGYYVAVTRFHALGGDLPLTVSAATLTVDNASGKCPSHTYVFTGKVKSNGAGGKVTYEWVKPDGTLTNNSTLSVPSGETESIYTLQFTFQGDGHTDGDAILHVLSPANLKSGPAHVQYLCP